MTTTRSRMRLSAVGALAAGMAVTLAGGTTAQAATSEWRLVKTVSHGKMTALHSVVATGEQDAWAFGGHSRTDDGGKPVAMRRDGAAWKRADLPERVTGYLRTATASAADNIWVAGATYGENPYLLRWDGNAWSVPKRWRTKQKITDLLAFAPDNVWVFGTPAANPIEHFDEDGELVDISFDSPGFGTWRFDGQQWTKVDLGFMPDMASATGPNDIWAYGRNFECANCHSLVHFDGEDWNPANFGDALPPEIPRTQEDDELSRSVVVNDLQAVAADDVWASGRIVERRSGDYTHTEFLVHWNGSRWSRIEVPEIDLPNGSDVLGELEPDGSGGLWVMTDKKQGGAAPDSIVRHRSAAGKWMTHEFNGRDDLGSLSAGDPTLIPGTTSVWAVGSYSFETGHSTGAIFGFGDVPGKRETPPASPEPTASEPDKGDEPAPQVTVTPVGGPETGAGADLAGSGTPLVAGGAALTAIAVAGTALVVRRRGAEGDV